jgi:putative peptidoglycan lipid II flippase
MFKEILVAACFGMSDDLDAYLLASLLPTYAINVIASSIDASFIPVYIQVRETQGRSAAQRLFSGILLFNAVLLVMAAVLMGVAAPPLLSIFYPHLSPERIHLILNLLYITLPCIVMSGLCGVCEGVLNAGGRFIFTAVTPCIVPALTIVSLAILTKTTGIYSIAIGLIGGLIVQLAVLIHSIRLQSIKPSAPLWSFDPAVKKVARQYFPTMAASAMMCSTAIVDQSMASMLGPGSVAELNFGNKIVAFVLTIEASAIGTVILPYFSRMAATADWDALRRTLFDYVKLILLTTVPIMAIGMIFSTELVSLLFERGKFGSEDSIRVGWVQTMFLVQVPFYSVSILLVRLISSLQANRILLLGTLISVGLNILLNLVLASMMGVAGIALSTSIVYAVSAGYLTIMARKLLKPSLS